MGGNGEPLATGRIWSGPLKLLLPALRIIRNIHSTGEMLECTGAFSCYGTHRGQAILSSSTRPMTNGEMKHGGLDAHHRELQFDMS